MLRTMPTRPGSLVRARTRSRRLSCAASRDRGAQDAELEEIGAPTTSNVKPCDEPEVKIPELTDEVALPPLSAASALGQLRGYTQELSTDSLGMVVTPSRRRKSCEKAPAPGEGV
jgi:hypothetical protein